jgi:hypothetical protein
MTSLVKPKTLATVGQCRNNASGVGHGYQGRCPKLNKSKINPAGYAQNAKLCLGSQRTERDKGKYD